MSTETPGIGDNSQDKAIEKEGIAVELSETVNLWLTSVDVIESEEQAEKATDLMARIKEEIKETDAARMAEKRPNLDANAAIEDKYRPIKNKLETLKNLFLPKLNAWGAKKEAERVEKQRIIDEEALEQVRLADEAAKAAKDAQASTEGSDVVGAVIAADEAAKAADKALNNAERTSNEKTGIKGKYSGRKTSMRTTCSADITDYSALLEHCKDDPKVKAALEQIAGAWARSPEQRKVPLPGVKLVETNSF